MVAAGVYFGAGSTRAQPASGLIRRRHSPIRWLALIYNRPARYPRAGGDGKAATDTNHRFVSCLFACATDRLRLHKLSVICSVVTWPTASSYATAHTPKHRHWRLRYLVISGSKANQSH